MTVDIGAYGRQSDSSVFTDSNEFRHLEAGSFNLPPPRQIPHTNVTLPYVLLGDQGYPLKEYLMRPYPTDNDRMCRQKQIFNFRLSRAWRCLKTEKQVDANHVDKMVRTVCYIILSSTRKQ
jgi:hypothetical protein